MSRLEELKSIKQYFIDVLALII